MSASRSPFPGWMPGSFVMVSLAVLVAHFLAARAAAATGQEDHGHEAAAASAAPAAAETAPYPLAVDPVTGERLGSPDSQIVIVYQGRELRFASPETAGRFGEDPSSVLARLDARIIADQLPSYPLATCLVSGEALSSSMGEPVNIVAGNRLVRFCCAMCEPKFHEDPAGYIERLNEAVVREQGPTYPLDTCIVSGEKLGDSMGKPVDFVFANRLVRLCCNLCKADFAKDPAGYLAKLDRASRGESTAAHGAEEPDPSRQDAAGHAGGGEEDHHGAGGHHEGHDEGHHDGHGEGHSHGA